MKRLGWIALNNHYVLNCAFIELEPIALSGIDDKIQNMMTY